MDDRTRSGTQAAPVIIGGGISNTIFQPARRRSTAAPRSATARTERHPAARRVQMQRVGRYHASMESNLTCPMPRTSAPCARLVAYRCSSRDLPVERCANASATASPNSSCSNAAIDASPTIAELIAERHGEAPSWRSTGHLAQRTGPISKNIMANLPRRHRSAVAEGSASARPRASLPQVFRRAPRHQGLARDHDFSQMQPARTRPRSALRCAPTRETRWRRLPAWPRHRGAHAEQAGTKRAS